MKRILTRVAVWTGAAMILAMPCRSALGGESPEGVLTLEKTIGLVRENHPALKAAAEEITAADARVTKSRSTWFPQITASAGYTYIDPVSEMSFGGSAPIKFMPNNNYDAKVTARATIFDFGKRGNGVELALSGKRSAEHALEISRRELSWQSIQLFYGNLLLHESIRVEQKEIAALNKALDFSTKRYQAGSATRFDLLSTEVRIAAARSRALDLAHALRRNELALRRLTGIADNGPLTLNGSFSVTPSAAKETGLVAQALQQRLEVKLSIENEKSAGQKRSIAIKEGMPVITGSASYGRSNGYQPDIEAMRNNIAAGLHLEIPIFSGFRNSAERQEATALMHAATLRRLDTEQQVKNEVEEMLDGVQTSSKKLLTTDAQVNQAKLAAEHARARFENGMATTLDLLDTEASLSQAELARLNATYEYIMNSYTLKRATGEVFW
ncbi:TolC family protein [Chlorobium sp. KB01]|uniref:TolC family protein n=1 Tax=Chlorobium sp. KB01 TaxID=1917528 RepID=UPI000975C6A9|nr:TolC family protein [Chlorobium sp. KB01]